MRLFIGYRTTPDVRHSLSEAWSRVSESIHLIGKPIPDDQWHLTVAFLGEVDEGLLPHIEYILSSWASKNPPPQCHITSFETFPHKHPRYMTAHLDVEGFQQLSHSIDTLRDFLSVSAPFVDRKPWTPHISICKAKHGMTFPLIVQDVDPIDWMPKEIALVKSELSPNGVSYTDLMTFSLQKETSRQM